MGRKRPRAKKKLFWNQWSNGNNLGTRQIGNCKLFWIRITLMVYPDPDHNPNHDPNPNLQILISKFDLFLLQAWGRLSSLTAWWWILILILILILISKSNYSNLIFVPSLRKVEPLDYLMANPDPPENPHFAPSRCVAIKLTRKLPKILQNPHLPLNPLPTIPY